MSDLRFSCPACGQHIQCDASHAGENLPCPACAVLTRVPADAAIVVKPIPATESVSEEKASYAPAEPEKTAEVFPTLEENLREEAGHPELGSIPVTEREHQIAEARKVHAAQGGQPVKPRLSFILSGGAAPDPEENQAALQTDGQKDSDASHLEAKTLHE